MSSLLASVRDMLESGRHLDAWEAAAPLGPIAGWRGPEEETLAGRLAYVMGAPRLGATLHLKAGRRHRDHPLARYYHARALLGTAGPWPAWRYLQSLPDPEPSDAELAGDWWALRATVAGRLRDFQTAEECLARAERLAPHRPWLRVERSVLLEEQDRHAEALAAVLSTLHEGPYRAGVARAAYLLPKLGRLDDAVDLLEEASQRLQAAEVEAQLALLRLELQQPERALRCLDRHRELARLLEPAGRAWEAGLRSDAHDLLGDTAEAARWARQSRAPFFEHVAARLESGASGRRVRLQVPGVQQHHLTCAPASVAALTSYWHQPVDHLELARQITYAGTPGWRERQWAESAGWLVREFRVTWTSARALLDRGLPFTLVTTALASAHEQTVCGYDERRGTLLIRDPSGPFLEEAAAERLLAEQSSTGPRGLLLVPVSEAARLEGLDLPEAALYDRFFALDLALARHDRAAAQEQADALAREGDGSTLVFRARQALAIYDLDDAGQLDAVDAWRERHPTAAWLEWRRIGLLRALGRLSEARESTAALASSRGADPLHWQRHGEDLIDDGRQRSEAGRWLRRALRRLPREGAVLASLARLSAAAGRSEEVLELRRFAACLDPAHEPAQEAYFSVARQARREQEALELLRDRVRRFGSRSSAPARTLFTALDDLQRTLEAFAALEQALSERPDDGELMLFAAEADGRYGRFPAALSRLEQARGCSPPPAWHRCAARLAQLQGHSQAALAAWRAVVVGDPSDLDAQRELCQVLQSTEGPAAVRRHLARQLQRCPHHHGLLRLQVEWARAEGHEAAAAAIEEMLGPYPGDAWTLRERALLAVERQALDLALADAHQAQALEPWSPSSPGVLGHVLTLAGRHEEARPLLRRALELAADYGSAAHDLVACGPDDDARRAALRFLLEQVERQGQAGAGLLTYRGLARGLVPPDETLAALRALVRSRPDIWQAFSALALQAADAGQFDEAEAVLGEGLRRFPLVLPLRLDLARIAGRRGDPARERAALEEAVRQEPGAAGAARRLGELLAQEGRLVEAQALLEQLVARQPAVAENHAFLADVLWQSNQRERAVEHLVRAVQEQPTYEWAWDRLREWSTVLRQPGLARDTARALVAERPAQAQAWLALARELEEADEQDERFQAIDRALALAPRWLELHDQRARWLSLAGRHEEALAACAPAGWPGELPRELRGRALWVRHRRGETRAALDGMAALLERETGYPWGTRCLVEWLRDSGAATEYHAAAQRLVHLSPDDASAYGHRGEALERLGRVDEAVEDYRRAVQLDPGYPFGRNRLLELLLEQERGDEGLDVLLRLGERLPGPERHAWRARLASREPALAMTELEALLRHPETTQATVRHAARAWARAEGGLELLLAAAAKVGTDATPPAAEGLAAALVAVSDEAAQRLLSLWPPGSILRCRGLVAGLEADASRPTARGRAHELTQGWPQDARHWLLLDEALAQAGAAPKERETALERAVALDPDLVDGWDRLAELLDGEGRHDEARRACQRLVGGRRPLPLRGREAWLLHRAGQVEQAVEALWALLQESPRYDWGWRCLLGWLQDERRLATRYLEAARRRSEVEPGDPEASVHLGQALERNRQPEPAAEAYARALALAPQDTWAAESLFDMRLKQARLDQAEAALAGAPRVDTIVLRRLQLHLRRGQLDRADACLAELCAEASTRRDVLEFALGLYADERLDWRSGAVLARALAQAGVHPLVARRHVSRLVTHGSLLAGLLEAQRLLRDPALAVEAVTGFLETAGTHNQGWRVRYFLWRHREALRRGTRMWGQVGCALMNGPHRRALAWLADWRERPDARGWMLANVALLLREAGQDAPAAEASRVALERDHDHARDQHRLWLALDAAVDGHADEALRWVQGLQEGAFSDYYRYFFQVTQALVELARGSETGRETARGLLRDAAARDPNWVRDALKRRLWRRARQKLWAHRGRLGRLRAVLPW